MKTIYLSLGSNIGNRKRNLRRALAELEKQDIKEIKVSSLYETEPVGPEQRNFYNIAGKFKTSLQPGELLKVLKEIEEKLGREKTFRWGPRVIDIDILFYGKQVIKTKNLIIPHKEIINRAFVLVPMAEISANYIHPVYKKAIKTLNKSLQNKFYIKCIEKI
jgi:2-amino-4-hydroxy-6-hydroxymethyldihydropteridine diphosphokinase